MATISPRQQRFCKEYLVDLNAAQAAIRAGYSKNTAVEQGSRLLMNVNVKAEIHRLQQLRTIRTEISADAVLERTNFLANSNIFPVLEAVENGSVKEDLPEDIQKTVKSVKRKVRKSSTHAGDIEEIEVNVVMHDVNLPLQLLWKHLGLLQTDAEAIATLLTYGTLTKTETGFIFEYGDINQKTEN